MLVLLDFSLAFDTIDHSVLVHLLHIDLGFTDAVLQWFSCYLTDCKLYVSLLNHCPTFAPVHSSVPQGLAFGMKHFSMYIMLLSTIIDFLYIATIRLLMT